MHIFEIRILMKSGFIAMASRDFTTNKQRNKLYDDLCSGIIKKETKICHWIAELKKMKNGRQ